VVQDIEELRPELYIEAFRNSPDGVVLTTEKSRFIKPGPDQRIAADITSKVEASQIPGASGLPTVGGAGSQLAVQKAWLGAIGTVKQLEVGLMYSGFVLSFRKFRSIGLHPGTALG